MSTSSLDPQTQITIRVGERTFTAHLSTLTGGSPYFAAKFSDRWSQAASKTSSNMSPANHDATDKTISLDANPNAFEHVLEFLRFNVYPLLWDGKTFDLSLYNKIASLASYLLLDNLATWIYSGKFQNVVRVTTHIQEFEDLSGNAAIVVLHGEEVRQDVVKITKKTWRCPSRMYSHDHPSTCATVCIDFSKINSDIQGFWVEHETTKVVTATRRVEIDMSALRGL